jgi:hypothetical protein
VTEAELTRQIISALNRVPNTYAFKIHGGPNQAGVSDVICCHLGAFYALEVKLPGKERNISKLQARFLYHINEADGVGILVTSVKQVLEEVIYGYSEQG